MRPRSRTAAGDRVVAGAAAGAVCVAVAVDLVVAAACGRERTFGRGCGRARPCPSFKRGGQNGHLSNVATT